VGGSAAHQMWCGLVLRYSFHLHTPIRSHLLPDQGTHDPSKPPQMSFKPTRCSSWPLSYSPILDRLKPILARLPRSSSVGIVFRSGKTLLRAWVNKVLAEHQASEGGTMEATVKPV
jgi:hypothetical protein